MAFLTYSAVERSVAPSMLAKAKSAILCLYRVRSNLVFTYFSACTAGLDSRIADPCEGLVMADTGFTRPAPEADHGRPSPRVESQLTGPTSYSRSRPIAGIHQWQVRGGLLLVSPLIREPKGRLSTAPIAAAS